MTTAILSEHARLAGADFDGTIARTFDPAPTGIGVHEAHKIVIAQLFGCDSLAQYTNTGGLRNRSAAEIVQQLLPDATPDEIEVHAQILVESKLAIMLDQIDGSWPKPTEGFLQAWEQIHHAQTQQDAGPITTAVITAGHAPFIHKTFDVWGIPRPDILIADETIRAAAPLLPIEQKAKPAPLPMLLAWKEWLQPWGLQTSEASLQQAAAQTVYIGDDPLKDGGLAAGLDIPFVLLAPPEASAEAWRQYTTRLGLGTMAVRNGG